MEKYKTNVYKCIHLNDGAIRCINIKFVYYYGAIIDLVITFSSCCKTRQTLFLHFHSHQLPRLFSTPCARPLENQSIELLLFHHMIELHYYLYQTF